MKKTIIIIRIILGCLCILFGFYILFTNVFHEKTSGSNYWYLVSFLCFLTAGILQLVKRNEPIEKREYQRRAQILFWTIIIVAFVILIFTVNSQQKQIEKMNKIEQPKNLNE